MFHFPVLVKYSLQNSRRFYTNKCWELKQRFLHVWHGNDQTVTDNAIDEWRGRLRACMRVKADTSSNYGDNIQPYDRDISVFVKFDTIFRLLFWKLPQFHTSNFRKVVWQHTEGMVGNVVWVLLQIYLAFSGERILKIR